MSFTAVLKGSYTFDQTVKDSANSLGPAKLGNNMIMRQDLIKIL